MLNIKEKITSKMWVTVTSITLTIVFAGVFVLGIVALIFIKFGFVGAIILTLGVLGLLISVISFFRCSNFMKSTTFLLLGLFHVGFMIGGISLICVRIIVRVVIVTLSDDNFKKFYESVPESFKTDVGTAISKTQNTAVLLGVISILISVILLLACVANAFDMGVELSAKTFLVSMSVLEIVIGFAISCALIGIKAGTKNFYLELLMEINFIGWGLLITIIVFGFFFGIVGIFGLVIACEKNGKRWKNGVFTVGTGVLMVGFLVLFILCIVAHVVSKNISLDVICKTDADGVNPCQEATDQGEKNVCRDTDTGTQCYTRAELTSDVTNALSGFTGVLIFLCVYIWVYLILVVFSTFINCVRKNPGDEISDA